MSELASDFKSEEWVLHELTHRLARPHSVVADLDVAVEEDVGVRASDKLEHLYPERGLGTLAVLQHAQGLCIGQHRAAGGRQSGKRSEGGLLVVVRFLYRMTLKIETKSRSELEMNCRAEK